MSKINSSAVIGREICTIFDDQNPIIQFNIHKQLFISPKQIIIKSAY